MFPINVAQLTDLVNGTPATHGHDQDAVLGASIDSRRVIDGDCFFALRGERTHGELFADQAVARGAVCVVADINSWGSPPHPQLSVTPPVDAIATAQTDERIVRVDNPITALQSLGRWNRRQSSALVIGVTGSVGKSTTRQMIAHVLGARFSGVQSQYNYNNELGVPLALSQLKPEHDFAVLELAAARPGDIAFLADMVRPEFAVVTRVAAAHLESFGDLEAIRQTKMELPAALEPGNTAFLNADDPLVRSMRETTAANVILFGSAADADFRVTSIQSSDGVTTFQMDGQAFRIEGARHLVTAAVAAVAVGRVTGLRAIEIAERLAEYEPDAGRGRIVQRHPWTVIDESYNASPVSVLASIQTLHDCVSARRRILVLGDMLELGTEAGVFHCEAGRALAAHRIDHTLLFGEFADTVAASAMQSGVSPNRVSVFRDIQTLNTMLDCLLTPGDVVLIKGSRGMHMERIVATLQNSALPPSPQRMAA